jgi:hypothetical protein
MAKEALKVATRTRAESLMCKFATTTGSLVRGEFIFDWKQRRAERREIARHEQAENASFGRPLKEFISFE